MNPDIKQLLDDLNEQLEDVNDTIEQLHNLGIDVDLAIGDSHLIHAVIQPGESRALH